MTGSVFLDWGSVDLADDLDPAPLAAVLPGLEFCDDTPPEQRDARLAGRAVVVTNQVQLDAALIAAHPELRLIALTATGTNSVDLDAARHHGVAVCNIRDYCTPSVVQHVFAVLLALTHRLREYDRALKAGAWEDPEARGMPRLPVRELAGLTIGIVGYGTLGQGVARAAEAFGMTVLVANRSGAPPAAGRVELARLLAAADVVSLHCPITPATRNLIGAHELSLMKPDAVLINTARGGLVDAAALAAALRAGRLGGAGIDVLAEEPPLAGNPLLAPDLGNLIVTPHTAWAARESRQRGLAEVAANVADFFAGGRRGRVV
jgi:glycerate dehydrogenase